MISITPREETLIAEPWFVAVSDKIRERGLAAQEALFHQGDEVAAIFLLLEGRLRLSRHTSEGNEVVIHVALAGDTFAEAALFSDLYHCDAIADIPSRVAVVPKAAVLRAFETDPTCAKAFMTRLARQVQALRSRLEIRNIRSANERVYQFLLLAAKAGEVRLGRPLKDAAAEIGLSQEAFYRALASLAKEGRITRQPHIIRVTG